MYYVIQENTFREENFDVLVYNLERLELEYEIVKVLPFIEEFEFKTDRKDVFCFGCVKMSRIAYKYGWTPGSLMNENHDYRVYSKYYKDNLLNYDSKIQRFDDDIVTNDIFFARPCLDSKTFTGMVFDIYQWNEFKENHFKCGHVTSLTKDTEIQISSVKHINKEFRFWIVDGKVVTGSLYRLNNWTHYDSVVDDGALEFCKEMVNIYQLADAFVMDICEIEIDGQLQYKIIECGCINSAGFYKADMFKILQAIENKWN